MIVDQARHQCAAAAFDDACVGPAVNRDLRPGNVFDQVASNQYVGWFGQRCASAVEYPDIVEQRYRTAGLLRLRRTYQGN
jgi:hypothetical protein